MRSALSFICRRYCRKCSLKITKFPKVPCPPLEPMAHPCAVANDVIPPQEQVKFCELRTTDPCALPERPKPPKPPRVPFRSMWEISNALSDQRNCKDIFPRFDFLFYKPTYGNRIFQRTWVECPPVKQRLRKVCCLDGIEPPEVIYRVKKRCPDICGMDHKRLRALCSDKPMQRNQDPIQKLLRKCCKSMRCRPSCKIPREKTICTRLRAPYPSYSEMNRGSKPLPSSECRCQETVPRCVSLQVEIHRNNIELKPNCWSEASNAKIQ